VGFFKREGLNPTPFLKKILFFKGGGKGGRKILKREGCFPTKGLIGRLGVKKGIWLGNFWEGGEIKILPLKKGFKENPPFF